MASKKASAPAAPFTGTVPDTTTLPKLRDIGEFEMQLDAMLGAAEGEMTPEIEQFMATLDTDRNGFFERWALHIRNEEAAREFLLGAAAPFQTEADRFAERIKRIENRLRASRDRLVHEMLRRGIRHVDGKEAVISIRDNPASAVIPENIPADVLEKIYNNEETRSLVVYTPETFALDKAEVKKAINAGVLPDELEQRGVTTARSVKLVID
jgi:hypothetical protein